MFNDLARESFEIAKAHGFHDDLPGCPGVPGPPIPTHVANLHGEVSEIWEAFRKGVLEAPCDKIPQITNLEEEIADLLIRVLDLAHQMGSDVDDAVRRKMAYNRTRPFKHGKTC